MCLIGEGNQEGRKIAHQDVSKPIFNPLKATEKIQNKYFRFFTSSFAPNNLELESKLNHLKQKEYMWRSPYVSISQQFKKGREFRDFVKINELNPVLTDAFNIRSLYLHQEKAIANALRWRNTMVTSGTGSGKTEVFLIPILNYCIEHSEPGTKAIIVYPMNALANDQVERLRKALYAVNKELNVSISFAIYTGGTPESKDSSDFRDIKDIPNSCPLNGKYQREMECPASCDRKQIFSGSDETGAFLYCRRNPRIKVGFQKLTRSETRANPPDILITNYVQMEYLLLRRADNSLFSDSHVKFLVFDEIHAYAGARGIDVSLLIRRLRRRLGGSSADLVNIGTSATVSRLKEAKERKKEIASFASKLFGAEFTEGDVFEGEEEEWVFRESNNLDRLEILDEVANLSDMTNDQFGALCRKINPSLMDSDVQKSKRAIVLGRQLQANPVFQYLVTSLEEPRTMDELVRGLVGSDRTREFAKHLKQGSDDLRDMVWSYLKVATLSAHPDLSTGDELVPLVRVNIHNFFKAPEEVYSCNQCGELFSAPRDKCDNCGASVDKLGVCRFCGSEFLISYVPLDLLKESLTQKRRNRLLETIGKKANETRMERLPYTVEGTPIAAEIWQTYSILDPESYSKEMVKCIDCGSLNLNEDKACHFCGSDRLRTVYIISSMGSKGRLRSMPHNCPFCGNSYGRFSALSSVTMSPNTASTTFFDMVYAELPPESRKLLVFTDNRQAASYLAAFLEDEHLTHNMRSLLYTLIRGLFEGRATYRELKEETIDVVRDWYWGDFEGSDVDEQGISRKIDEELTSELARQRSLENLGLVETVYYGLHNSEVFSRDFGDIRKSKLPIDLSHDESFEEFRKYLISLLNIMRMWGAARGLEKRFYWEREPAKGFVLSTESSPIQSPRGISIRNILSLRSKPMKFTRAVFGLDDQSAVELMAFAYDLLKNNNLIVLRQLRKGRSRENAYVVNMGKALFRIPDYVWKCNTCKRTYTNLPRNVCLTWGCSSEAERIPYSTFDKENRNHYYLLYKESVPVRMVTQEDTGALDLADRRRIETDFKSADPKERKIDVIVATPTLELGVDIGDLLSIGLFKSPPSPVNYLQRVGRAGRKEGISLNNTFLFFSPIDMYYFGFPQELIKGEVRPPFINLSHWHMVRRHLNAVILEDLIVFSPKGHLYPTLAYRFQEGDHIDTLKSDLKARKVEVSSKIRQTLKDAYFLDITDEDIESLIQTFGSELEKAFQHFESELRVYLNFQEGMAGQLRRVDDRREHERLRRRREAIDDQIWKLQHVKTVIELLMEMSVLPRYAFPGIYVDLVDPYRQEDFGGRSRNYAITEYAPGMEVFVKKHIYESAGIDYKFTKPKTRTFYVCGHCSRFISDSKFNVCPLCKQRTVSNEFTALAPELIYLRRTTRSISEPREYQEPISDFYIHTSEVKNTKMVDNFRLSSYGNVPITSVTSGISVKDEPEPRPIELCQTCGKARSDLRERRHRELGGREWCDGEFEKVSLFHQMPTNVISLRILGGMLYNIPIAPIGSGNQAAFLTTLKSAIINAAQMMVQAEDGEIDGIVKGDEILFFDNVEGGVGYVDQIFDNFGEVLSRAADLVLGERETFGEECTSGCLRCLWSYRRRRDIRNIDKQLVIPVLQAIQMEDSRKEMFRETTPRIREYWSKEIRTIHSPTYSLDGVKELKDILRSAKDDIKLTSLYVTDTKIDWPDEGSKSWVDILSSIRQGPMNTRITIIVKEPTQPDHKRALRRLVDSGIDVRVFKEETPQRLSAIVHSKLIVVDPLNPRGRHAIHTSSNFSPEMWKNHETFDFGENEEWVKGTYEEILRLEKESRPLRREDLLLAEGITTVVVEPGVAGHEIELVGLELGKAEQEVFVMDPYLTRPKDVFAFLFRWIKKDVEVRIVTARTNSDELQRVLEEYRRKGFTVPKVLRYFDRTARTGKETILHDRYLIIDKKKVIELGKGLTAVIEALTSGSRDNVILKTLEIPSEVEKYIADYEAFWDYGSTTNKLIRDFPKEEY